MLSTIVGSSRPFSNAVRICTWLAVLKLSCMPGPMRLGHLPADPPRSRQPVSPVYPVRRPVHAALNPPPRDARQPPRRLHQPPPYTLSGRPPSLKARSTTPSPRPEVLFCGITARRAWVIAGETSCCKLEDGRSCPKRE